MHATSDMSTILMSVVSQMKDVMIVELESKQFLWNGCSRWLHLDDASEDDFNIDLYMVLVKGDIPISMHLKSNSRVGIRPTSRRRTWRLNLRSNKAPVESWHASISEDPDFFNLRNFQAPKHWRSSRSKFNVIHVSNSNQQIGEMQINESRINQFMNVRSF